MWELEPETVPARPYPALWPLAGMMRGMTPEGVVSVAEQIVETPLVREQQSELIGQLVILAGVQLAAEALRRHPLMDELLEASSTAQAFWEEGRQEGREEGRMEEAREMARIALESRFDTLAADVLAAIQRAAEPTLKAAVACKTLEQVRARLGLAGEPQ